MRDATPPGDDGPLPADPDVDVEETDGGSLRPVHLSPVALALVFAGGTIGTAAREAITLAVPPDRGVPYAVFGVNVAGALLLGVLLEALARRGPDRGRRRNLRLLFGTGALGGFTTYSALAVDSAALLSGGSASAGVAYGLATVLVGAAATWCGVALAARGQGRRRGVR